MRKIADRVYNAEDIILGEEPDEFEITVRPNTIKRQRRAMAVFDASLEEVTKLNKKADAERERLKKEGKERDFDEMKYQVDRYDAYLEMSGISLEKALAPHFDKPMYDAKRRFTPEYLEFLEEVLDQETMNKVIEVCVGIKLNDPNLIQAMMEAQQESSGAI